MCSVSNGIYPRNSIILGIKEIDGLTRLCSQNQIVVSSTPILVRINIQIDVPKVEFKEIISKIQGETSAGIRIRVQRARKKQLKRFLSRKIYRNAQMSTREVKMFCPVGKEGKELLEMAVTKLGFSARAYTRVLKVARTIADLEGQERICADHISEAIQYRMLDKYF